MLQNSEQKLRTEFYLNVAQNLLKTVQCMGILQDHVCLEVFAVNCGAY